MRIIMSALLGMSLVAALAIPISAQAFERQGYYKKMGTTLQLPSSRCM